MRGWNSIINIKVTECNISNWAIGDRHARLHVFVNNLGARMGIADTVTYSALPPVGDEPFYEISEGYADGLGRQHEVTPCTSL